MDTKQNTDSDFNSSTANNGDGHTERRWNEEIAKPIGDLMARSGSVKADAGKPFDANRPLDSLNQVVEGYRANHNPESLVAIAAIARREYLSGRASGHAGR